MWILGFQRFSELCENLRVSSHQILTSELTGWKLRLRNHCSSCNNTSTCTSKHPPLYVTGDSLFQVRFPTCQFYLSKFDVTRPLQFSQSSENLCSDVVSGLFLGKMSRGNVFNSIIIKADQIKMGHL